MEKGTKEAGQEDNVDGEDLHVPDKMKDKHWQDDLTKPMTRGTKRRTTNDKQKTTKKHNDKDVHTPGTRNGQTTGSVQQPKPYTDSDSGGSDHSDDDDDDDDDDVIVVSHTK